MKKIKTEKIVNFTVRMSFDYQDDKTIQTFSFIVSNKKHLDYVDDSRYLLKDKLEKIFRENLCDNYLSRSDEKDNVKFYYRGKIDKESKIFNVSFYLPPNSGCAYCSKKIIEGDYIYCTEKKKHYDLAGIKRCAVFHSQSEN